MATRNPSPRAVELLHQAFAHHQQGRFDEAWALYEQVLDLDPRLPDALHLSGCVAIQRGAHGEAAKRIAAALEVVGANAMYLVSYGNALAGMNRHGEAEAAFRQALALNPSSGAAHNNLANLLVRLGRYEEAMGEFDRTLTVEPRHINALLALGHLLADRGALTPALTLLRRARDVAPDNEKALLALARACCLANETAAALEAIEAARRLRPDSAEAHTGAGTVLGMMQRYGESIASFRRALALQPGNENALNGLVESLNRIGRTAEAIEAVRLQMRNAPSSPLPHSSLLFLLNYLPDMSASELSAAHRAWNARFALPIASAPDFRACDRDPERPLRIGYVSTDFRTHSVSFFIEPIFEHHDRKHFEIVAYHSSSEFDPVSARLKSLVREWRDVPTMSDQELADLIRADRIDILVDLNGHTGHHRLLAFARRPAPVQVSYLGYPNTTGLSAIQYRISDAVADPPGAADDLSSEALLRLPDGFHCYRPADGGEPDFTPPAGRRGYVTFGSFNVVGKINPPLVAAWAKILEAVPGSRLLLKTRGFSDPLARAPVAEAFAALGIAPERVVFDTHQESRSAHMARYREVDIALDTFPYNGTTTTCDALWMGVPVVTVRGDRHAARVGASLLQACRLEQLVAPDVDAYVECAVDLARNPARLSGLHGELRGRLQTSPLMDEAAFARKLESAWREAWRRWCAESIDLPSEGAGLSAGHWQLRLAGDITVFVPATLDAMTPAVLLEQEDWFEAEMGFVRRYLQPGMKVIDIGANYGIYTLNAARRVGPQGSVLAFEPAPNTRRFLSASVAANAFEQVRVEAPAVSDATGEAWIALNWNPELNSIVEGPGAGSNTERIPITTLDAWNQAHPEFGAGDVDFIKMDAEGHERKVLAGSRKLLAQASPLVMFELKHGAEINAGLIGDFGTLGFGIYRLIPGLDLLTRFDPRAEVDPYELNLFACKAGLAHQLETAGWLAEREEIPRGVDEVDDWLDLVSRRPALAEMALSWRDTGMAPAELGLAACAGALAGAGRPATERVALLATALSRAERACAESDRPSRLHTLARIAWMSGRRSMAIHALRRALALIDAGREIRLDEPFLPAAPDFDSLPPGSEAAGRDWLTAATLARLLQLYCFSGYFAVQDEERQLLDRARMLPHFTPALERRRQLARIRAGQQQGPECTALLAVAGPGNLNPGFWCPS